MHIHREIISGTISHAELALVVSNNSGAGALEYARANGLRAEHLSAVRYGGDQDTFEREFLNALRSENIDLIVLAGYLKKLPDAVVNSFEGRILNVHPALLPSFGGSSMYGLRVHEAVLARGCKVSGATVHFVTQEYDVGPIIMQRCCPVKDDDTPQTLQKRVQTVEHEIYPKAIELVAADKVTIQNGRVFIAS